MNKSFFLQRNVTIDIFRSLTMLLMIFVNDFWTVKGVPHWLEHAATYEDFLGLSDVVFPLFLFVMGMSIPYAIEQRYSNGSSELSTVSHILSRTFALLIMGVFTVNIEKGVSSDIHISSTVLGVLMVVAFFMIWNRYPKRDTPIRHLFTAIQILGCLLLAYLAFFFRDGNGEIMQVRWWGILGIIGWTYLVCSFIYLFVRNKIRHYFYILPFFILLCVINSSQLIPDKSFFNSLLDIVHIRTGAHVAFTTSGMLFSLIVIKYAAVITRKKILFVFIVTAFLFIAAIVSNNFWIISKNLATPPWLFYCLAIAVISYALIQWMVNCGKASWFDIIKPAGTATLTCYLIPYLLYSLFPVGLSDILPEWMTDGALGLIKCAIFAFFCIGITKLLEYYKIKIKV